MATRNAKSLPKIAEAAKETTKKLTWEHFEAERAATVEHIVAASHYEPETATKLSEILNVAIDAYARKRAEDDFWKRCEGKQVLNELAPRAGYANGEALTFAALAAWERHAALLPDEVGEFRVYLTGL